MLSWWLAGWYIWERTANSNRVTETQLKPLLLFAAHLLWHFCYESSTPTKAMLLCCPLQLTSRLFSLASLVLLGLLLADCCCSGMMMMMMWVEWGDPIFSNPQYATLVCIYTLAQSVQFDVDDDDDYDEMRYSFHFNPLFTIIHTPQHKTVFLALLHRSCKLFLKTIYRHNG